MTKISLLDMGKTKKRNTREAIIQILSNEFPLTIKKVYNHVKKEYKLDITYQAVFKLINEMLEDGILEKSDREYKLNLVWISSVHSEVAKIESNYFKSLGKEIPRSDTRILNFIDKVGPSVKQYLNGEEGCIVSISGGAGIFYAVALWKYLLREGESITFEELDKINLIKGNPLKMNSQNLEKRKLIMVDSAIHTGTIYRHAMEKMNSLKGRLKIKDIKFAVDSDSTGLADFSVSK